MSAPKTNIDKQKRRHWAPLLGMALVALFGVALIVYWQFEEAAQGLSPGDDAATVPGTEREVVPPTPVEPASGD
jgi:hypothetical protein